MSVVCRKEGDVGVVQLSGPLTAATTDTFRERFSAWQEDEADVKHFVLDLSEVDFMDSAGLGALIASLKRMTDRGGSLKLASLQKKPRMVLEITRAYRIFDIFSSVDEALAAVRT